MEFEYVGLIIGDDLIYRNGRIETDYHRHPVSAGEFKRPYQRKPRVEDEAVIDTIIRNTYKVLFTRGQKGLYLYVMDKDLREYLKKEIDSFNESNRKRMEAYLSRVKFARGTDN